MNRRPRSVAIIGGGPGGAHCARRLAEAGCRVTLFEPRLGFEKPCGGGVPLRCLERFPFLDHPALPGKAVKECLVVAPSGREARFTLHDPLFVFSRGDLHRYLMRRAGAAGVAIEPARVVAFHRDHVAGVERISGWWLRSVAAGREEESSHGPFDFLVAADGAAGPARRRLVGGARSVNLSQGVGYFLPGISEGLITLKFYAGLNGYLWIFPRPDHSSAGICDTLGARPASGLKELMDDFLRTRYGHSLLERSERYAALIPAAPDDAEGAAIQGDGWALVGDAGRFVDPLTREGIFYAMLSGEILAEALAAGRPESYAATWRRSHEAEFLWAARHAGSFFAPRFLERLVALCGSSRIVARVMSDLLAGRQPYTTLKRRLILNAPRIGAEVAARRLRLSRDN